MPERKTARAFGKGEIRRRTSRTRVPPGSKARGLLAATRTSPRSPPPLSLGSQGVRYPPTGFRVSASSRMKHPAKRDSGEKARRGARAPAASTRTRPRRGQPTDTPRSESSTDRPSPEHRLAARVRRPPYQHKPHMRPRANESPLALTAPPPGKERAENGAPIRATAQRNSPAPRFAETGQTRRKGT